MTPAEMPTCPHCGAAYPSAWAASTCCDPEWDKPSFTRPYEIGNN